MATTWLDHEDDSALATSEITAKAAAALKKGRST
jgi:hypothetical protein